MIISKLTGGLGNQMFQYAIGRNLAEKNNTILKIDKSYYNNQSEKDTPRNYALGIFNVQENFATLEEIKKYQISKYKKIIKKLFFSKKGYVAESKFNYDSRIMEVKDDSYLDGYWQTEKYFKDIEKNIRDEFSLKHNLGEEANNVANKINESNSVSIHIRRGDYVANKYANTHHGTCTLDYYHEAIKAIKNKINNPYFFVFSDDIDWAKENLKIDNDVFFVTGKEIKDYEEMHLMSRCKNNIIANSSFSWWGAWLNSNPNKVVIAPKKWFNNKKINTSDLIPDSWLKI